LLLVLVLVLVLLLLLLLLLLLVELLLLCLLLEHQQSLPVGGVLLYAHETPSHRALPTA
jgi:hypothetical protein